MLKFAKGSLTKLQIGGRKLIIADEIDPPRRTTINDLGSKLAAQLLLCDSSRKILIPSAEEWIGLGCLERDDELPNRRKPLA